MLKLAIVTILPVLILAQLHDGVLIDDMHGCRVEYDEYRDVIVFVCNFECYIIEFPDGQWDQIVRNDEDIYTVADEIYSQMISGIGTISLTQEEAKEQYGEHSCENALHLLIRGLVQA